MLETLHPGIYFEELISNGASQLVSVQSPVNYGATAVAGAQTSVGAFIGVSPRGKVAKPVLISNWTEFIKHYGGFTNAGYLAYAVKGFFENGGKECYIVRVAHHDGGSYTAKTSTFTIQDSEQETPIMKIDAKSEGVWGDSIKVVIDNISGETFDAVVSYKEVEVEKFTNVTLPLFEDEAKNSAYINVTALAESITEIGEVEEEPVEAQLASGNDGLGSLGDSDYEKAIDTLKDTKVNLIAVPGVVTQAVHKKMLAFADSKLRCTAILDAPLSMTPAQVKTYVTSTATLSSENGAIYYPFLKVNDPIGVGKYPTKLVPPCGHVMGTMARLDASQGVWRATAGVEAKVFGALDLAYDVKDSDQDVLNPINVNCIRAFDGEGILIWGARTLSNGEFKYISNRRLVDYIENSLAESMKWTNFKPNDKNLWEMIETDVRKFLNDIWSQGGLKGAKPEEAYVVKCDAENNTQDVIDSGRTMVDIGVSLNKPNEFTVFRLSLRK